MPRTPRAQPAKPEVAEAPKQEPASLEEKTGVPATPEPRRPRQQQQSSAAGVVIEGKVPVLELYVPEKIEPEALAKLNVYQRWNAMIGEMGIVPKRGWNDHHKYWFTTDADLNAFVGPLLSKYHLLVMPQILLDMVERFETGGRQFVTRVPMLIKVLNADKPAEFFEMNWLGEGGDTVDKGVYKAMTGGLKYFYMKQLQVATGDDPEVFERTDALADLAARQQTQAAATDGRQQQRPVNITPSNREQPQKGGRQQGVTEVQVRQVKAMSNALSFGPRGTAEFIDRVLETNIFDTIDSIDDEADQGHALTQFIKNRDGQEIGKVLYEMGQEQARRVAAKEQQQDEPAAEPAAASDAPPGYEPVE